MKPDLINFKAKLGLFAEHWTPRIIAQMNDYHFKLVKIQGHFVWHSHAETDEVFIVLDGKLEIELRDSTLNLEAGEMVVVPRGVEHRPYAAEECSLLLVELAGTVNTGETGGEMTAAADRWI